MPVDSDFFKGINSAQYTWYHVQKILDEQDNFELLRDVAEHNAMFWNSKGVEQVRSARQNKYETPKEDFESSIRDLFGRGIESSGTRSITEDDISGDSLKPYLDLELDEIKFTPYGG